jgi:hypothetical protein
LPNESLFPVKELLALNEGFDGNAVKSGFFSISAPKSGRSTLVIPKLGVSGLEELDDRPSSAKSARR